MNTQELRTNRGTRWRKRVIDSQEGTSTSVPVPAMIDVHSSDDDVIEVSASAFDEANRRSTRAGQRPLVVDVESGRTTRLPANIRNKRRRVPSNQPIIDCEQEVNKPVRVSRSKAPPEESKYTCPICICPFTDEMSTKCGHIFCEGCIKKAISCNGKCPTCRKKLTVKQLMRVFLPATRLMDNNIQ